MGTKGACGGDGVRLGVAKYGSDRDCRLLGFRAGTTLAAALRRALSSSSSPIKT